MNHIQGSGWGFDHDWERGATVLRATLYGCRRCGEKFWHHYPRIPNIGQAMFLADISEHCPALQDTPATTNVPIGKA